MTHVHIDEPGCLGDPIAASVWGIGPEEMIRYARERIAEFAQTTDFKLCLVDCKPPDLRAEWPDCLAWRADLVAVLNHG